MRSFAIRGHSDDVIVMEVDGNPDDETGQPRSFSFVAGTKTLHTKLSYTGTIGTSWKLTVEIQDEKERCDLPFDVRIVQDGHSPKLIVDNAREPVSVICRGKRVALIEPEVGS